MNEKEKKLKIYSFWKKKYILKIIFSELDEFDYSVNKNIDELREYFDNDITLEELKKLEEETEVLEKEIYLLIDNNKIRLRDILDKTKNETLKEFEGINDEINKYIIDSEYKNLTINENLFMEFLFEDKMNNFKKYKLIDYYSNSINNKSKKYFIDYENKLIKCK